MKTIFAIVALVLLCGAGSEHRTCKFQADFALMLFKDLESGAFVNVMPKDQSILDVAKAHKGSPEELWRQVYNECKGVRT